MTIIQRASPQPRVVGTRPITTCKRLSSADAIRSRLLLKLGIIHPNNPSKRSMSRQKPRCTSEDTASTSSSSSSSSQDTPPKQEDRKSPPPSPQTSVSSSSEASADGHYIISLKSPQDSSKLSSSVSAPKSPSPPPTINITSVISTSAYTDNSTRRSKIHFHPSVTVIPIPSHKSYAPHIHTKLFHTKDEMAMNTIRNSREFIYEGWNWRTVLEESHMYMNKYDGSFVHPAHVVLPNSRTIGRGGGRSSSLGGGGVRYRVKVGAKKNPYLK